MPIRARKALSRPYDNFLPGFQFARMVGVPRMLPSKTVFTVPCHLLLGMWRAGTMEPDTIEKIEKHLTHGGHEHGKTRLQFFARSGRVAAACFGRGPARFAGPAGHRHLDSGD